MHLVLQNPWLGYSSYSQLYYQLPAFGITNRNKLDMVQNTIYSLVNSDYGKDLDQMGTYIDNLRNFLLSNGAVNPLNPVMNQTIVGNLTDGSYFFLEGCKTCRAFCSL